MKKLYQLPEYYMIFAGKKYYFSPVWGPASYAYQLTTNIYKKA